MVSTLENEYGDGFLVAVLTRNVPAFYCILAEQFEMMMDKLEDIELTQLVLSHRNQSETEVELMIYKLRLKEDADKEWKKIDSTIKSQFKKHLLKRYVKC